jgi:hypothetical protein
MGFRHDHHMGFGIFIHRTDSIYDDVPSERYQFPKHYLTRAQQCEGNWIVYLEPSKAIQTKGCAARTYTRVVGFFGLSDQCSMAATRLAG